ncbi:hypothetical protein Efla_001098 [Eimeria flavescens]
MSVSSSESHVTWRGPPVPVVPLALMLEAAAGCASSALRPPPVELLPQPPHAVYVCRVACSEARLHVRWRGPPAKSPSPRPLLFRLVLGLSCVGLLSFGPESKCPSPAARMSERDLLQSLRWASGRPPSATWP